MTSHYWSDEKNEKEEKNWIDLSSLAHWWNDYDFNKEQWDVDVNVQETIRAFALICESFDDEISKNVVQIESIFMKLSMITKESNVYFM